MALESMKIGKAPAAFAGQAAVVNALVDLISKMRGTSGIICQVTEGGIVISLNPTALQGLNVGGGGGGGNANVGGTVQVVGTNGRLVEVLQPTSPNTPNSYPTFLQVGTTGAGAKSQIYEDNMISWDSSSGAYTMISPYDGLKIMSVGGNTLSIPTIDVTRNMGIKTVAMCNSGSPASMLVVGSDLF